MQFEDLDKRGKFEYLPEALFLEDFEGNILDVNNEACRLLGYDKEELLERKVEDIIPEEQPVFMAEEIDQATQASDSIETVNLRKDGTEIPVELRGRIIEIDGEERSLVSVRDISERKQAEEELSQSKQRYQSYFEELGDAVFITKVGGEDHGRILDANSSAEEQTGYSLEELIGMNIEDDIAVEPPEMGYEEADERLARGETIDFVEKKKRKDGTEFWTEVMVSLIEYEGQKASLSINRDITERKRVKEQLKRYRMAVEGSDDLMAACDKDYNYIFANEAYRSFYDAGKEEIQDYQVGDLIGEEAFNSKVKPKLDECLQGKRIDYEMERTHPYKGARQLRINYYPLKGEEEIHGAVAVMRDITKRKRAEQALNEERDKLRHLHDAVDTFQSCQSEEELYQTVLRVTKDVLNFDVSVIYTVKDDSLIPKASSGLENAELPVYKKDEALVGKALTSRETIWGEDLKSVEAAEPEDPELKAFMSVPIGDIGVFQAASKIKGGFEGVDIELAEILAGHLREEIERIRLEEDLRQQAIRDPLTDLYNRRYFNESLGEEVERCKRYDNSIAFLIADVNRFKEINDRYTHQTGDEVLKEVASLLEENVRNADTVVRYGGDEFLVMMPETNGGVSEIIERLEKKLSEWNKRTSLIDFPLTLAMGVSHWKPDQGRDVEKALKEADQKMYEDKGR